LLCELILLPSTRLTSFSKKSMNFRPDSTILRLPTVRRLSIAFLHLLTVFFDSPSFLQGEWLMSC
jgi:hypothetical protein